MGNVVTGKKNRQKGYTLAELLMVVAIILILAAFGFTAIFRYQRTLKRTEMDNIAREIFVAAQNHLTAAKAAGAWGNYEKDAEKSESSLLGEPFAVPDHGGVENHQYYYLDLNQTDKSLLNNDTMDYILPSGAIDDTVRLGGYYIIEYDATAAAIYGVFYTDAPGKLKYSYPASEHRNDTAYRNANGIGYYGGATDESNAGSGLEEPILSVRNAESLVLTIVDPNAKEIQTAVELTISGKKSGVTIEYPLNINRTDGGISKANLAVDNTKKALDEAWSVSESTQPIALSDGQMVSDSAVYHVIFDSIVRPKGHFADLLAGSGFIPGEDITVTATAVSQKEQSLTAKSSVTFNSLFGAVTEKNNQLTAVVSNARHLENLNAAISGVGVGTLEENRIAVHAVQLTSDIAWKTDVSYQNKKTGFLDSIKDSAYRYGYSALLSQTDTIKREEIVVYRLGEEQPAAAAGKFAGLIPTGYTEFAGNNHLLIGFDLEGGLFKVTGTLSKISDLLIADSQADGNLTGTEHDNSVNGSAGILAAKANPSDELTIQHVGVYAASRDGYKRGTYTLREDGSGSVNADYDQGGAFASRVNADRNAGGLIGSASGNVVITDSFVSVPVYSRNGNAGGLIGSADRTVISNTYVGGYADKRGTDLAGTMQDSGEEAEQAYLDYSTDTINIASPTGKAGGFIGDAQNVTVTMSYTTASVYGKAAGGFVGTSSGAQYDKTYTTARVYGNVLSQGDAPVLGGFSGTSAGDTFTASAVLAYMNTAQDGVNAEYPAMLLGNQEGAVSGLEEKESDDLSDYIDEADTRQQSSYTYAYQSTGGYPYPAVNAAAQYTELTATAGSSDTTGMGHHGDWPEGVKKTEGEDAFGVLYYERIAGDSQVYYHGYMADGLGESEEHYHEVSTLDLAGKDGVQLPDDLNAHGLRTSADTYVIDAGYLFLIDPEKVTTDNTFNITVGGVALSNWGQNNIQYLDAQKELVNELDLSSFDGYSLKDRYNIGDIFRQLDEKGFGITFAGRKGAASLTAVFDYREMFADSVVPAFADTEKEAYSQISETERGYIVRSAKQLHQIQAFNEAQERRFAAENASVVIEQQMDIKIVEKAYAGDELKNWYANNDRGEALFGELNVTYRGEKRKENEYRKIDGMYFTFARDLKGSIKDLQVDNMKLADDAEFVTTMSSGEIFNFRLNNVQAGRAGVVYQMKAGTIRDVIVDQLTVKRWVNGANYSHCTAGFAALQLGGDIEDCHVINATVRDNGFVGYLGAEAVITDCTVVNLRAGANGFANIVEGKIQNCQVFGDHRDSVMKEKTNSTYGGVYTLTDTQKYGHQLSRYANYNLVLIGLDPDSDSIYSTQQESNGFVSIVAGTGKIEHCSVTGSIIGANGVSGFVKNNGGRIEGCYANAIINEQGAENAYGFAKLNAGTIESSYVLGMLKSSNHGWGFAENNSGTIRNAYTAIWSADLIDGAGHTGEYTVFAPDAGTIENCYAMNQITLTNGKIRADNAEQVHLVTAEVLAQQTDIGDKAALDNTVVYRELNDQLTDRTVFPYPIAEQRKDGDVQLKALKLYGDWGSGVGIQAEQETEPETSISTEDIAEDNSHANGDLDMLPNDYDFGFIYYEKALRADGKTEQVYYHGYAVDKGKTAFHEISTPTRVFAEQGIEPQAYSKGLLKKKGVYISETGYLFIVNKELAGWNVFFDGTQNTSYNQYWHSDDRIYTANANYWIMYNPYENAATIDSQGRIKVRFVRKDNQDRSMLSQDFYYIPWFADTISGDGKYSAYSIRSSLQMYQLAYMEKARYFRETTGVKLKIQMDMSFAEDAVKVTMYHNQEYVAHNNGQKSAYFFSVPQFKGELYAEQDYQEERYALINLRVALIDNLDGGNVHDLLLKNVKLNGERGDGSGYYFIQNITGSGTVKDIVIDDFEINNKGKTDSVRFGLFKEIGENAAVSDITATNVHVDYLHVNVGDAVYNALSLIDENKGTLSNVYLNHVTMNDLIITNRSAEEKEYALIGENTGTVENVLIEDYVTNGQGLIWHNTGSIMNVVIDNAKIAGNGFVKYADKYRYTGMLPSLGKTMNSDFSNMIQNCSITNAEIGENGFVYEADAASIMECKIVNARIHGHGFIDTAGKSGDEQITVVRSCQIYGNTQNAGDKTLINAITDNNSKTISATMKELLNGKNTGYRQLCEHLDQLGNDSLRRKNYEIPEVAEHSLLAQAIAGQENTDNAYLMMVIGEDDGTANQERAGFIGQILSKKSYIEQCSVTGIILGKVTSGFTGRNESEGQIITVYKPWSAWTIREWITYFLFWERPTETKHTGIRHSYANVLLAGSSTPDSGEYGFVKENAGVISNCYAIARLTGADSMNKAAFAEKTTANINNCYAIAADGQYPFYREGSLNNAVNYNVLVTDRITLLNQNGVNNVLDSKFRYQKTTSRWNPYESSIMGRWTSNEVVQQEAITHKYSVYNIDPADRIFPYPSNGQMQYGDWPMAFAAQRYRVTFDTAGGTSFHAASASDETAWIEDDYEDETRGIYGEESLTENADGTFTLRLEEGTELELSDVEPVREGYTFMGWKVNAAKSDAELAEKQTVLVTQYADEAAANAFLAAGEYDFVQDSGKGEIVLGMEVYTVDQQSAVSLEEAEAALSTETSEEWVNYISADTLTVDGDILLTAIWTLDADVLDRIVQLEESAAALPEPKSEDTADQLLIEETGENRETEMVSEESQDVHPSAENVIEFPQEQEWETEADILG